MQIETINPYVIKIIISARDIDSINSISKRIGLSYGWTYKWVNKLTDLGVFKATRMELILNKNNTFYKRVLDFITDNFSNDVNFHYSVLKLFGISYCFTKTDAVYIWTKGGYNIARYKEYYPIFIKIKKSDFRIFKDCCNKLNLKINKNKDVFYKPEITEEIDCEFCNNIPVDPLDKTIKFMQKHIYNFEPALEMIKEMYRKQIKVKYREV